MNTRRALAGLLALGLFSVTCITVPVAARAGDLTLKLENASNIAFVGAINRWDEDGKPREPVDPKAKIDAPKVDAEAKSQDGETWVFSKLPAGRYDIIILGKDKMRVEGFSYPPIAEFDPVLPPDAEAPEDRAEWIKKDISKSQHYENKVSPLYLAGDEKSIRIFMQLVRDKPTSYDGEVGYPVATVRHEVWQYTFRYGGWVKERKTAVFDRILLPRAEFHKWTWVWEPKLGNIEVKSKPVEVEYTFPSQFRTYTAKGWFPD